MALPMDTTLTVFLTSWLAHHLTLALIPRLTPRVGHITHLKMHVADVMSSPFKPVCSPLCLWVCVHSFLFIAAYDLYFILFFSTLRYRWNLSATTGHVPWLPTASSRSEFYFWRAPLSDVRCMLGQRQPPHPDIIATLNTLHVCRPTPILGPGGGIIGEAATSSHHNYLRIIPGIDTVKHCALLIMFVHCPVYHGLAK